LDVAAALEHCSKLTSKWVVLVEDDCEACSGALGEVATTLSKLDANTMVIASAKFSKFVRATAFAVSIRQCVACDLDLLLPGQCFKGDGQ
jgi:hypothetical protein